MDGTSQDRLEVTDTFGNPVKPGLIIVPVHPGKEIGKGLLHSILKKAGLK